MIPDETLTQWGRTAEDDADSTVAPSGYYPSARILALIAEVRELRARDHS